MLTVTSLYAGLLGLLLAGLSARVIALRGATGVALGDGGDPALHRAIRVQGNFTEYAPTGLILLALAEMSAAPGWAIHVLGVMLFAGRALHALGVSKAAGGVPLRVTGTLLTLSMITITGAGLVAHALI